MLALASAATRRFFLNSWMRGAHQIGGVGVAGNTGLRQHNLSSTRLAANTFAQHQPLSRCAGGDNRARHCLCKFDPRAARRTAMHAAEDGVLATAPAKPAQQPAGMEEAAALLQAFSQVPSLGKGWAFPAADGVRVTVQLSQRNLPANSQRKQLCSFALNEAVLEHGEADVALPMELRDAIMVAPSPSGRRLLVVRPGNGDTSAVLEVWDRVKVVTEIHVPKALHGAFCNDGWFGTGAAWSADEQRVAYVAESAPGVTTPEWGAKRPATEGAKVEGAGPKGWKGVGEFQEDWGELNTGKRPPTLFVLDCSSGEVAQVQGLAEGVSCGQPQWSPDGAALLFVSWPHAAANFPNFPQRLGVVYCFNRPCALHAVAWPQPATRGDAAPAICLTPPELQSAFSPRFTPDGSTLVFLSQQAAVSSGVHSATASLLAMPWAPAAAAVAAGSAATLPAPRMVVDIIRSPIPSKDDFPGLYCSVLPDKPFIGGSTHLVVTTQWRSNLAVVAVDISTGKVARVTPPNVASWALVATEEDWILVTESSPSQPLQLYACHVAASQRGQPESWSWSRVGLPDAQSYPPVVAAAVSQVEADILQLSPTVGPADVTFEAVLLRRRDRPGPQPAIITPHGGPHTAYSAQFFMPLSFLVASGYNVILVNYRGSTGFGEASIQSLPGSIGTNDVADCMAALSAAVEAGHVDAARVAVVGGSHGGFLTNHLIGQHPATFKAAVVRNPVCDISLMVHLSDIPDWCFVEAWGTEKGKTRAGGRPTAEDFVRFAEISPISHVDAVTAPLLMMLGACDRRVPMDDGKQYLAALRRRADAPETRLTVFPKDTHGLDKPQTEFEQWLNVLWWLQRHGV